MTTVAQLKKEIDALRQQRDLHYRAGDKVQKELRTLYQRWYSARQNGRTVTRSRPEISREAEKRYRMVLSWHERGMTVKEIAARMGVHYSRALELLKVARELPMGQAA